MSMWSVAFQHALAFYHEPKNTCTSTLVNKFVQLEIRNLCSLEQQINLNWRNSKTNQCWKQAIRKKRCQQS